MREMRPWKLKYRVFRSGFSLLAGRISSALGGWNGLTASVMVVLPRWMLCAALKSPRGKYPREWASRQGCKLGTASGHCPPVQA
ncbi:hypothetical protein GCM10009107_09620 [Ideonella azotifigens]|uniref:Uncharacterized protein n=1 Tax=Ideonella azotifigens TaxID=513160 RepID=A0ABN1JQ14_9BURK